MEGKMEFLSVAEIAKKWNVSERSVRNYCATDRVPGAYMVGKVWKIPDDAQKPQRRGKAKDRNVLLETLQNEKKFQITGGIYHKIQVDLTYNSNHIEGSRLTHDQTRYIYETNTIGIEKESIIIDDIIETVNHFRCIDMTIHYANYQLTEKFIKQLHDTLKRGTKDSRKDWFAVGEYKKIPNEVGGQKTTLPENVSMEMGRLLKKYNNNERKTLEEILEFHVAFERIHPFQDGNGRVGRLILFKECLRNNIVPFIIDEQLKLFYYRGLKEWNNEREYLRDTCLAAQDQFKDMLDYFRIEY